MFTLNVRQSLANGTAKTWKLRANGKPFTFGSSRLAEVISISPTASGIQGVFEYKDNSWWFTRMEMESSANIPGSPSTKIDKEIELTIGDSKVMLTPHVRETDLYTRLDKTPSANVGSVKKFQLFISKQNDQVLETKIIPMNKKYKPSMVIPKSAIACIPSEAWQSQKIGNIEIKQRTISLEDAAAMARLSPDQILDNDSKRGVYSILGVSALLMMLAVFSPKSPPTEIVAAPPKKVAQRIIVKTEKPKKQKAPQAPQAPQQPKQQASNKPTPKQPAASTNKVANMMKSISGGRVSQLLGKVSAQAAKSANVVYSNGVKAGSGSSGRALAAVGNMEKSGRDWGRDGNGAGVVISTSGRGGGGSAASMGGLAAGATGTGGVGLIEEESEITGGLDREVISQYIKSKLGQILYCYERQLSAKPDLFGKVAVRFTIGPTGQVEQQLIGDTTLKNSTVEGCILNRVAGWKFPAPQGGTRVLVTYPFLFKSTN